MSDPGFSLAATLELCEWLLDTDSEIGHERELCDQVEEWCRQWSPHAIVRAANSLCIVPRQPHAAKRTLMLVGHLDTVPKLSDNPIRREGGKLYGLGASDMKAADAVLLEALERSFRQPARHDLVGVLYSREEGPFAESEMPLIYDAAREWFDAAELAICMEPTDNRIELGCLGTSHARFVFDGKRAHSARPWQGENAIHKAAGVLARLAALERRECEFSGLTFYEVASATMASFRGAANVVPDRFELNVNYRFAPDRDEAAVRAALRELAAGEATVELTDFCPAGRVCADNPLVAELREAAGDPEVCAKQAWTDVGRLSHLGLDAINWGPGATSQAHQAGEWVEIAEIERSLRVLERWLWPTS